MDTASVEVEHGLKAEEPVKAAAVVVEETKNEVVAEAVPAVGNADIKERGERRGRGEYRGRGEFRGERRGRGEYRGGERGGEYRGGNRGGYRAPREDADGFTVETGDKPKPQYRGRGRGEFRGGERGEFRGGEYRGGERGERRGGEYRGNDRRGGNRPKTEGTTQPAEQQQQAQQ